MWFYTIISIFLVTFNNHFCDAQYYELNIIHHNDFHARFEETSLAGTVCVPEQGSCIGGFARLYTTIQEILQEEPHSLVLDGGDTFAGTIWYNLLRWNVTQHFMNLLPHDAHVLGNHEFDHGVDGLVPYLENLREPMLCANLNSTLEPRMQGLYQNHVVVEKNGRKIGIIGVLLEQFSASIGNAIMEDALEALKREAAILTSQGVDIIVALTHTGFDSDVYMARNVGPEIDIIVGAHSHTLLYSGDNPVGDSPHDDYPTVVYQDNGHRVLIVQASAYTRYLGNIKLYFDDAGIIQGWEGQPIFLGTEIVQDPTIVDLLEPFKLEMDVIGKEVLAESKVLLLHSWCRLGECNIGNLVCDAFIHEVMDDTDENKWSHADICLINRGGLRTQIEMGDITTEGLLLAVPFENTVQTFNMYGRHILEALEFAVSVYYEPGDLASNRMLQVGGLRVVYNATLPANSRVQSLKIRCTECDVPTYEDVELDKVYRVVSHHYLGEGGDGFTLIAENRWDIVNIALDWNVIQDYLRKVGVVTQDLDGRIQVVY